MAKRFYGADSYYSGLPEITDADGKKIPKEITASGKAVQIWNDWYLEEIGGSYDPTDDIIDALDGKPDLEATTYKVGDTRLADFDIYEESRKSLTKDERIIFDMIWFDGLSFRAAEKKLGLDHSIIHNRYKKILAKLGRGIVRRHKIDDDSDDDS